MAVALAALELIDAFFMEVPLGGIAYALLLLLGAFWLYRHATTRAVIYTGALCLIDFLLLLAIFAGGGGGETPVIVNVAFVVASFLGTVAAVAALRERVLARS